MSSPQEVERISGNTYRFKPSESLEIWGRRSGLSSEEVRRVYSLEANASQYGLGAQFSEEKILLSIATSFDINRPLSGKAREQFLSEITKWAMENKLPTPFLQPIERSVKLDWPGLREPDIAMAMKAIAVNLPL